MNRPMLEPSALTAGFWEAAARGELAIQSCDDCAVLRHYPQPMCPECRSMRWSWRSVSGRGRVYTFTVTYQAFHGAWADRVPYAVATIELDEGVRVVADLPDEDLDRVHIGMPVEVFFDPVAVDTPAGVRSVTLPRFRSPGYAAASDRP